MITLDDEENDVLWNHKVADNLSQRVMKTNQHIDTSTYVHSHACMFSASNIQHAYAFFTGFHWKI